MEIAASALTGAYWPWFGSGRLFRFARSGEGAVEPKERLMTVGASTDAVLQAVEVVTRTYVCRDEPEVTDFLRANGEVAFLMLQVLPALQDSFGPYVQPTASIMVDPEGAGRRLLVLGIPTSDDVPAALAGMDHFDTTWLLENLDRTEGRVAFTLDFQ